MKKVLWEVQYLSLPKVSKHCKKCGKKTSFSCSEKFRINAQQKSLYIWLIYKCSDCDATWNASVHSHILPQSLNSGRLEGFYNNDETLVAEYAMNSNFLHENGVEIELPPYVIIGNDFLPDETVELEIRSEYSFPIKVSALIRRKLHLSQAEYSQLIENGNIKSVPKLNLQKYKLKNEVKLIFNSIEIDSQTMAKKKAVVQQ